jgi:hypothetical protein
MVGLTLEQFRDIKLRGFPGWETAVTPSYEGAAPYVEPIDARFGAPSYPFGTDTSAIGSAFERWCADNLVGDYFITAAGASGGLVYCQLRQDVALLRKSFGVPSTFFQVPG